MARLSFLRVGFLMSFVHTHVHSGYSLLDSMIRIDPLIEKVASMGQNACALTDHGTLAGVVKFTEACLKKGIKPILGQEFYIAPDSRFRKKYAKGEHSASHLILLAKNDIGWKNLMELSTRAYTEGFYKRPRVDRDLLAEYSDGLICTSACIGGDIAIHLKGGLDSEGDGKVPYDPELAATKAAWYFNVFGADFYLEMQSYGRDYQESVNAWYRDRYPASQLIGTADCHYLDAADADTHDTLLCCQVYSRKADPDRWRFVSDQFYLKSEEEMLQHFSQTELDNTQKIADSVTFELPLRKQFFMPTLPPDIIGDSTATEVFTNACNYGLARILGLDPEAFTDGVYGSAQVYRDRLDSEMGVFITAGFVEYTLLLWDLMRWCASVNIFTGDGRGSGAGSLVLYALGITRVDPVERELPFERFINAGRLERFAPPDVDLDFPQSKRGAVIAWLRERYGHANVCAIGTYATLGLAAVLKKLAEPLDIPISTIAKLTAIIPAGEGSAQGSGAAGETSGMSLAEIYEQVPSFRETIDSMGDQGLWLMHYGAKLSKLGSHASKHASGLIITDRPVSDIIPLMAPAGDTENMLAQVDMFDCELLGLVKFDILGIATLDVLAYVQEMIRKNDDPEFSFDTIDLDDPKAYALLAIGKTSGIFQAAGGGFGRLLPQTMPTTVEHLSALTSLCRPGPSLAGITDTYVRRIRGEEVVIYDIPQLEPILEKNYGIMCYQEDIMNIAHQLAGYTLAEADDLRKIMGKKQKDKMPAQRIKFLAGLESVSGISPHHGENLFAEIAKMAEYVFNRSHAMAYSYQTAKCAWAKAHYPAYFMAAAMSIEVKNTGMHLPWMMQDARFLNCTLRPPDINLALEAYAALDPQTIMVGLLGIRDVGAKAVQIIVDERERGGNYTSRQQFMARLGVLEEGAKRKKSDPKRPESFRAVTIKTAKALESAGAFDAIDGRKRALTTERLLEEFETFGFFLSGHPCERYRRDWAHEADLVTLSDIESDTQTTMAMRRTKFGQTREFVYTNKHTRGIVTKIEKKKSKASNQIMLFLDVEDETGSVKILLNQKQIIKFGNIQIAKGQLLDLVGRKADQNRWQGYFEPSQLTII